MSNLNELRELEAITKAKYDQQQQSFRRIQSEENRLRAELRKLDEMLLSSNNTDVRIGEMRAIGADVIWQGWVGRSKTELNLKLAQVLAIKEQQLQQVRQAFGKLQVAQQLITETNDDQRKKKGQSRLELAMDTALHRVKSD
ncbi:hypothetical protein [Sulfitobacter delicatus]|uniref:Flagellar FliJ protein n=1 Tax=Sulfitobacter delicatus TaxID=218672 RepID=A0A1G7I841_9RHOB|nr:hypothetical protein [Sulfitobacter delicatus]SDF08870.1 hypothetical protein SAMN04489759_101329 [Sulfitobacter delicatus]